MAKKSITKTIEVEYDYVIFDGTNFDAVREFVNTYKLYGNSNIEESFHKRPEDIPNLDEYELLQWWESTGEEVVKKRGLSEVKYNTHHRNNMPLWRKDELLMIEFKCEYNGYVQKEWLGKNDAVILIGRKFRVLKNTDESKVMDFIEGHII